MNQSIYTESAPLLARKDLVEWLDGCGAVWGSGAVFSKSEALVYPYVCFGGPPVKYFQAGSSYHLFEGKYTHTPTGTEFCERVAEILGLDKPTFEVDISKKETTTDHIPYVGQKVDEQDKLFPGRNNTMGEGALTQEDIEILLGDSIVKPIKGMAIEVSRLSEQDREWLINNVKEADILFEEIGWNGYAEPYVSYGHYYGKSSLNYSSKSFYECESFTITESPTEFLEYVGKQTGKEYGVDDGPKFEDIAKALGGQPVSEPYKFKSYRILDSLDGIPLDTRISLSEWIPPILADVILIYENNWSKGFFGGLDGDGLSFQLLNGSCQYITDGHWMRIV